MDYVPDAVVTGAFTADGFGLATVVGSAEPNSTVTAETIATARANGYGTNVAA
jgi:hypothetical protein